MFKRVDTGEDRPNDKRKTSKVFLQSLTSV